MLQWRETANMVPVVCWKFVYKLSPRLAFLVLSLCTVSLCLLYQNFWCVEGSDQQWWCLGHHVSQVNLRLTNTLLTDGERTGMYSGINPFSVSSDNLDQLNGTDIMKEFHFDKEGDDVLVFLHIQKTGGSTFVRHLVKDLEVQCDCETNRPKECDCYNSKKQIWMFNRFSVGWACGLHADWNELTACIDTAMDEKEGMHRNRR